MVGYKPEYSNVHQQFDYGISAISSSFINRLIIQPLDVIKIRLMLQVEPISVKSASSKYTSMWQTARTIVAEEGFRSLWKGHLTAQLLGVSFSPIQFTLYEYLTRRFHQGGGRDAAGDVIRRVRSGGEAGAASAHGSNFLAGLLAGCTAVVVTQPLDVLKARLIAQGEPKLYRGVSHGLLSIARGEGVRGLYRGLGPSLLTAGPQSGAQFMFYEAYTRTTSAAIAAFKRHRRRRRLHHQHHQDQVEEDGEEDGGASRRVGFVQSGACGFLAGISTKLALYPFDMVRRRMQLQGFRVEEARRGFGLHHKSAGLLDCVRVMLRQEGALAFYKGLTPALIKSGLNIGLRFMTYEQLCNLLHFLRSER